MSGLKERLMCFIRSMRFIMMGGQCITFEEVEVEEGMGEGNVEGKAYLVLEDELL